MAHIPSKDLIEATHSFPCLYVFKVIGLGASTFEETLLKAFTAELSLPRARHSKRLSGDKKHIAITLEVPVGSADEVTRIYEKIVVLPGLTLLL